MKRFENCDFCGGDYLPLVFPMRDQKVMLISAAPSLQAVYKPLTSVRFFRRVCFALFGDKYLREKTQCEKYLLEFYDGGIYWTHYRKCYDPRLGNLSLVDDVCAKRYLADEVRTLKPELIIVLGSEIEEKVRAIIPRGKTDPIYMPFPDAYNAADFEEVRKKLRPYLKHVKKSGFTYKSVIDRYVDESGQTRGQLAHLRFELGALERMFDGTTVDVSDNRIESLWYRNIVVPNMQRCAKLVSVYSFAENQIKTLLYENKKGFKKGLDSSHSATESRLKFCWANDLKDYVDTSYPHTRLSEEIRLLRQRIVGLTLFRNAIVHGGGFVSKEILDEILLHGNHPSTDRDGPELLPGIFLLAGTVFISSEGEQTLTDLARRVTELLCEICERERL